jgi:hypothetical protein
VAEIGAYPACAAVAAKRRCDSRSHPAPLRMRDAGLPQAGAWRGRQPPISVGWAARVPLFPLRDLSAASCRFRADKIEITFYSWLAGVLPAGFVSRKDRRGLAFVRNDGMTCSKSREEFFSALLDRSKFEFILGDPAADLAHPSHSASWLIPSRTGFRRFRWQAAPWANCHWRFVYSHSEVRPPFGDEPARDALLSLRSFRV